MFSVQILYQQTHILFNLFVGQKHIYKGLRKYRQIKTGLYLFANTNRKFKELYTYYYKKQNDLSFCHIDMLYELKHRL